MRVGGRRVAETAADVVLPATTTHDPELEEQHVMRKQCRRRGIALTSVRKKVAFAGRLARAALTSRVWQSGPQRAPPEAPPGQLPSVGYLCELTKSHGMLAASAAAVKFARSTRLAEAGPPTRSDGCTSLIARAEALYSGMYDRGKAIPHSSLPATTTRVGLRVRAAPCEYRNSAVQCAGCCTHFHTSKFQVETSARP